MGRPGLVRDVQVRFWLAVRAGLPVVRACVVAGCSLPTGTEWLRQAGGVMSNGPSPRSERYLSLTEREEIAVGRAVGESIRSIARRMGRPASTISREIARNTTTTTAGRPLPYRASVADRMACDRGRRPKTAKLAGNTELRDWVQAGLTRRWSPTQISATLAGEFPDRPEMRVSHETIYQSLYVQGRGALRRELASCLRTGRALRKPRAQARTRRQPTIPDMVPISDRPAEVTDRAVPGHWEGDLIIGRNNRSAIGTLVERTTRFCLLLHLPTGYDAITVRDRMIEVIHTLPTQLRRSLTWDQGSEMRHHAAITLATDLDIYFCDPHSPWQRGSNENTNGLLRQYFPKSTDLSVHDEAHLQAVAAELNGRPRHTLGWRTPAQALTQVLSHPNTTFGSGVATTP
jgi:IS30 family transposase